MKSNDLEALYTAVDMATAAADGFRDGRASVVVELPELIKPDHAWSESQQQIENARATTFNYAIKLCRAAIIAAGGNIK